MHGSEGDQGKGIPLLRGFGGSGRFFGRAAGACGEKSRCIVTARNYVYKIPATVMRAETHNNIVSQ